MIPDGPRIHRPAPRTECRPPSGSLPARRGWDWLRAQDRVEVLAFVLQAIALWYMSTWPS